jgi:hypothetical protein
MNFAKAAVSAAAIGLLLGASAAYAQDEDASPTSCSHMADEAKAAVRANARSANHDAANVERREGAEECRMGYYKLGLEHYKKALELLGGN